MAKFHRYVSVAGAVGVLLSSLTAMGQQTRPVLQAAPVATEPATPSSTAPMVASVQGNQVSSDSYIIGPGDVLQLTVWKEPGLSNGNVPVRPDGNISMSLLGDVHASGITPMALGKDIATSLKKYINDPLVTVTVLNVQPKQIFLIGEIQHTGAVVLMPGMTVLQALAAGGGLTNFAKKKLYILRRENGKENKIPFDYKKAFRDGDQQGVTLMAGDTIVVP